MAGARRSWQLSVDLARDGTGPVFLRIARALTADIRRGRLRPGEELPGSRTLAASLGVHRNTVLAAYRELTAEGWVETTRARGTFVSSSLPEVEPRRFSARAAEAHVVSRHAAFVLPAAGPAFAARPVAGGSPVSLAGGVPDVRLVPGRELSRAVRRILAMQPMRVLSYGDPEGPGPLREAIADMLQRTRGIAATADDVLVTRGSQMGLDLAARALLRPGDAVAVEALGYAPAWGALRAAGLELVPIPVDAHGLDVEALERAAARCRLRAVYVTPHHQYPTTVSLSAERRLRLLALAEVKRFFVLEDDYDHEFHYEGRPVLPLASADVHGSVVYVGTLSKVLAPGLRIGFVVAPRPARERMTALRRLVDRQGDHLLELAVAELLDEGVVQRHIRRARRIYAARREALAELLRAKLADRLSFRLPVGGTAIWARVHSVSAEAWRARAAAKGLVLQSGKQFAWDGEALPFFRLGFAQNDARETREAVARLVASCPAR